MSNQATRAVREPGHLGELVTVLWPGQFPGDDRLVVLPHAGAPRLVVPRRPRTAAAAAVRNYKAYATGRARLLMNAAALAVRLGAADLLPDRISPPDEVDGVSIEAHLREVLGRDLLVSLYIGPSRAVEKPVLQLLTPRGRTFAFAKLGINPLTRRLIRNEVATLRLLAGQPTRTLAAPGLLHAGRWREHELVVQAALTPHGNRDVALARLLPTATREVGSVGGVRCQDWSSSSYRRRLSRRIGMLTSGHRRSLERLLDDLDTHLAGRCVEFGSWHGDWAPWNMTGMRDRVAVWDWEHFEVDVPFGLDAVHHDLSRLVGGTGCAPAAAMSSILDGTRANLTNRLVPSTQRAALVTSYITELATRYVEDGEDLVGGTPVSRLGEWLPEVLTECERALGWPPPR